MRPARLLPLPPVETPSTSACLVLVDLVDSTRLAQRLPLSHYTELMTEFVQVLVLSFEALHGHVLQHQGDAVLAYWPAADTPLAVQAALHSHGRAARLGLARVLGTELKVRAGLAQGEVITCVVGGQLSAYGLPVNYARRLCDAAHPGETLACAGVAGALPAAMPRVPRGGLDLHGFGPDCTGYALQNAAPVPTAAQTA